MEIGEGLRWRLQGSLPEHSRRLSSWDSGNCNLTLTLGARLGNLGCTESIWERVCETPSQQGQCAGAGLESGSAVQDLPQKWGRLGGWLMRPGHPLEGLGEAFACPVLSGLHPWAC